MRACIGKPVRVKREVAPFDHTGTAEVMIPLKDENPSRRFPVITYALIGVNIAVFCFELSIPQQQLQNALQQHYGMVPAHVTEVLQGERGMLSGLIIPLFASMFIHGGFLHLGGNMLFLHVFGDNVEAKFRHGRFLVFYLVCGVAGSCVHYILASADSTVPTIGASGAIAGVLGAYIVMWPKVRVITVIPIFYFIRIVPLPAFVVLGLWFVLQLVNGAGSLQTETGGGVAYWAHVGGFATGTLLAFLISLGSGKREPRRRKR